MAIGPEQAFDYDGIELIDAWIPLPFFELEFINGNFQHSAETQYLGVRFDLQGRVFYGWIGFEFPDFSFGITVTGYAYNNRGKLILAGQTDALGDYNRNGGVDAADYVLWRDSLNQSVPHGTGPDGDGNGVIDHVDYRVWAARFGTHTTGVDIEPANLPAIPEPANVWLVITVTAGITTWRHKT